MKRLLASSFTALALAALVVGCSSPSDSSGSTDKDTPAVVDTSAGTTSSSAPMPNAEQAKVLYSKLGNINAKFDSDKVATKAHYVCASILKGDSLATTSKLATVHFSSSGVDVSEQQATQIIEAVKSNGFCKKA